MVTPEQMTQMQGDSAFAAELQAHTAMVSKRAADLARQNMVLNGQIAALQRTNADLTAKVAELESKPAKRKGAA